MSLPITLGFVWLIAANVTGMFPSKRNHWPAAYVLIGIGLPLLMWIIVTDGILLGLIFLGAAMSVLRWPVFYFWKWLNRVLGRKV